MSTVVSIGNHKQLLKERVWHFTTIVSRLQDLGLELVHLPNIPGEWYFRLDGTIVQVVAKNDLAAAFLPAHIHIRTTLFAMGTLNGELYRNRITNLHVLEADIFASKLKVARRIGITFDEVSVMPHLTDYEHAYGLLTRVTA